MALRLAERLGFDAGKRAVVYYAGLLAWVGCHMDAYEQAKWFGDDQSLKADAHYGYDFGRRRHVATTTSSPPTDAPSSATGSRAASLVELAPSA
jgi:hypothetical protein